MLKLLTKLTEAISAEKAEVTRSGKTVTMLGRLPQYFPKKVVNVHLGGTSEIFTRRANKYLIHQERRIFHALRERKYNTAAFIWMLLLKRSVSYQLCLINRAIPYWYYKYSEQDFHKFFMDVHRKCRKWDLTLTLQRFYLDKGLEKTGIANGKFRPIGAPTLVSRVIVKALNDMVYYINQDNFKDFQHGYRINKGCYTALYKVWQNIFINKQTEIYEFDFKSFFNNVSPLAVYDAMLRRSQILGELMFSVLKNIRYQFQELKEEAELKVKFAKNAHDQELLQTWVGDRTVIHRSGLPQGLAVSPLLATMVLESCESKVKDLVMYADDGLIFGSKGEAYQWFGELEDIGVYTEPTKSGEIFNEFKFLGTRWNISERWVKYIPKGTTEEHILTWKEGDEVKEKQRISEWFKFVASIYGKKPGEWTWDINDNSWAMRFREKFTGWESIYIMAAGITNGQMWKGFRYFLGKGIFNVSGLSSMCCAGFLKDWWKMNENPSKILTDRMRKNKLKSLKKELNQIVKEENIENFERILDGIVLDVTDNKLRINRRGRVLLKSSSNTVLVDPNYKWEGTERPCFRNYTKYAELVTPYENIYFSYMSNPKLITNIFLNMETSPLGAEGRLRGNGKHMETNNKYIFFNRSKNRWWNKGLVA
jgi:hypothetical protein